MSAFRVGQRVRYVRHYSKGDRADLERRLIVNPKVISGIYIPLGAEGTVILLHPTEPSLYVVKFDEYPDGRACLGYMIEPLTDSYQKTSWDALKDIWSPHETVHTEENKTSEPA